MWSCVRGLLAAALTVALLGSTATESSLFRDGAEEIGLRFHHVNGAEGQYHLPEIMGAGGALFDFDADGDLDVLLIQGGSLIAGPASRPGPRVYRNELVNREGRDARLRFTDVTARTGLKGGEYGMGVAVGDYDNDGDSDVYLTNFGPNRLYRNEADGTFTDVTPTAGTGLDDPRWSTSAAFCDYDADGDLDLFVTNYVVYTVEDNKICHDPTGARDYCGPRQFQSAVDRLFRNDGAGRFSDVTEAAGITTSGGAGLGVVCADLDGDARLDFYVANDATANQLWVNRGDGSFMDGALLAGVALNAHGQPEGSMGIAADDADGDGDTDLFVTNITRETHAYYRNLDRGRFEDARVSAGFAAATAPYTGFGTDWLDYDNDGWLDLLVANGAVTILDGLRPDARPFRQKNQLFLNRGGGRFVDVTAGAGPPLQREEVSRGAAFGDVDNDGDIDVLMSNNAGPARLLLNQVGSRQPSLTVQLEGVSDNRQGLGARVSLLLEDGRQIWRRARTDGSYLSASDPRVHFGLGRTPGVRAVTVEWPRRRREVWSDVPPGRFLSLRQGTGTTPR